MEKQDSTKDGKARSQCPASRVNGGGGVTTGERQRLEDELTKLKKVIQEKDQQMFEANKPIENDQSLIRDIRTEKEASINERRRIDADLQALNNEMTTKRDLLMKLQGSLQYRTEEALNEAIRRLEVQLETNNYRVIEEKKIVQEIDRLKRSKKNLKEYLSLREDLDKIRDRQRLIRDKRESLHRHVTSLKSREDRLKKDNIERRSVVDRLRRELDELHEKKRSVVAEVKLLPAPTTHQKTQAIPQRRPSSFKRKESCQSQRSDDSPFKGSQEPFGYWKKDKIDPLTEKRRLCTTLTCYMQKLMGSPVIPNAPVIDNIAFDGTQTEIQDGEKLLVLLKKNDDEDCSIRANRGSKKGRKDRKKIQNKLLSHTPEMIEQFSKLGLNPPSMLSDVPALLEALAAKALTLTCDEGHSSNTVTCEQLPCGNDVVSSVIENESIKMASIISQMENDILGSNCDSNLTAAVVMNGDITEKPDLNDIDDLNDMKLQEVNGNSAQVTKIHLIKISYGGSNFNGVSSTGTLNGIEEQLIDGVQLPNDCPLPLLINSNVNVYGSENNNTQSCNTEFNVLSPVNGALLPDL